MTYPGKLGGPDVDLTTGRRTRLVIRAREYGGVSRITAAATNDAAIADALVALVDLTIDDATRRDVLETIRRAITHAETERIVAKRVEVSPLDCLDVPDCSSCFDVVELIPDLSCDPGCV